MADTMDDGPASSSPPAVAERPEDFLRMAADLRRQAADGTDGWTADLLLSFARQCEEEAARILAKAEAGSVALSR